MNWLKENWFKIGLLAILVVSVIYAFYWYEWRPSQYVKKCNLEALKQIKESQSSQEKMYDFFYQFCLRKEGYNKQQDEELGGVDKFDDGIMDMIY